MTDTISIPRNQMFCVLGNRIIVLRKDGNHVSSKRIDFSSESR